MTFIINNLHLSGTFVTIVEPTVTHHYVIHLVYSLLWGSLLVLYGFGQMYDICASSSIMQSIFTKNLLCSTYLFSTLVPFPSNHWSFHFSLVVTLPEWPIVCIICMYTSQIVFLLLWQYAFKLPACFFMALANFFLALNIHSIVWACHILSVYLLEDILLLPSFGNCE